IAPRRPPVALSCPPPPSSSSLGGERASHTLKCALRYGRYRVAMRVLVVEDDPMIGRAVLTGLRDSGYATDWVRDGVEAELALSNGGYDAALLDLGLPRREGMEILKSLRRDNEDLPVLIITARDAVSDRIAGLDSGADDYLVKPFSLE